MPPKPKFTKEEILNAAFDIAREKGIDAVAAREVGKRLGTSSSPIFTFWGSMDELLEEIKEKAMKLFGSYLLVANKYSPSFKMRGMQMIKYAQEEPKLFRMLFMAEGERVGFHELMNTRVLGFSKDLKVIQRLYEITEEEALLVFNQLWIQAYGICVLCATNICRFTEKELSDILGQSFAGAVMLVKSGKLKNMSVSPALKGTPDGKRTEGSFLED